MFSKPIWIRFDCWCTWYDVSSKNLSSFLNTIGRTLAHGAEHVLWPARCRSQGWVYMGHRNHLPKRLQNGHGATRDSRTMQNSEILHLDLWSASAPEKTPQMWEMSPKGLSDVSDAYIESLVVHCKSQAQDRRRVDSLCYARCGTCCSRASSQHFWGSEWHPSRSAPWPAEVWTVYASNWNKTAPVTLRQESALAGALFPQTVYCFIIGVLNAT